MDQPISSDLLKSVRPELLPGILAEVAQLAGVEAALRLAERHGGARRYIPHKCSPEDWLAKAIGFDAAKQLVRIYAGDTVQIASCRNLIGRLRARTLRLAGLSVPQIVKQVGMSQRCVERYVQGVPKGHSDPLGRI